MYKLDNSLCSCNSKSNLSQELKQLESALNEAVNTYASLYYGSNSITSVYVEPESEENFIVAVLIKKTAEYESSEDDSNGSSSKATWDSVHLFEINPDESSAEQFCYHHTATIMLSFDNSVENLKNIKLSGNIIRQNELKYPKTGNHLIQIGSLLEDTESRLRSDLQSVYFGRTHDIVNELRSAMPEGFLRNQNDFRDEMMARLNKGK